ncbi:MAG: tetratricopeptide repeat protein [Solirubrobacterales bacterium]|nr:tetratricopeptide repeat protein [Solirubrobacterales bacterium]
MVHDVSEAGFQKDVLDRSHEVPVVVDFWAEWCGPCRQLGPALEAEAGRRGDDVDLAKVDVDSNQMLASRFGVQGIPAVKAFVDGEVAAEFTGAIPPAQVRTFFDSLVPSEADRLAEAADEASLRRALELDPAQRAAALKLARLLLAAGDGEEARTVLEPFADDFTAAGMLARLGLGDDDPASPALAAWDEGDHERALELLQEQIAAATDPERVDVLRRVMVAIFTELGPASELAREHRRRLSLAIT